MQRAHKGGRGARCCWFKPACVQGGATRTSRLLPIHEVTEPRATKGMHTYMFIWSVLIAYMHACTNVSVHTHTRKRARKKNTHTHTITELHYLALVFAHWSQCVFTRGAGLQTLSSYLHNHLTWNLFDSQNGKMRRKSHCNLPQNRIVLQYGIF